MNSNSLNAAPPASTSVANSVVVFSTHGSPMTIFSIPNATALGTLSFIRDLIDTIGMERMAQQDGMTFEHPLAGGLGAVLIGSVMPLPKDPQQERGANMHGGVMGGFQPVRFVLKPLVLKLMGPTTTRLEVFPSRDGTTPFGHPLLTVQVPRELKPSDLPFLRDRLFAIAAKFSPTADRPPE